MGRRKHRKKSGQQAIPAAETLRPAPLWKRFAAMFYDFLLVVALSMITTFIYLGAMAARVGGFDRLQPLMESGATLGDPTLKTALFLVIFFFFAYFWKRLGQTLGMQVWRIKVVSQDGRPLTWTQCLLRFFAALFSLLCFGMGFFWSLWDRDGLTWHDRYAGTRVIEVKKT
ncbi:RDD family protein [Hahella sp. SMD15-11]|uniref:RDD family protein n=1 Tax=Thermohahella caldifontis TaxID=3142973 RepID=A0AB39UWR0_9GAMM